MSPTTFRAAGFLLIFAISSGAHASDPAKADALFREGRKALAANDLRRACSLLEDSLTEDPGALGTLTNLAYCHEALGKHWRAYREYAEVLARTPPGERHDFALRGMAQATRSLPRVRLQVSDGTYPAVQLDDGWSVSDPSSPFPVAPGKRTLTLTSRGQQTTVSVEAPERPDVVTIVVAPSGTEPPARQTTPVVAPALVPLPPARAEQNTSSSRVLRPLGFAAGAVGVAALGLGAFFGLRSFQIRDSACPSTTCSREGLERIDGGARTTALLSTIAFGVGITGVIGGGVMLYAGRDATSSSRPE